MKKILIIEDNAKHINDVTSFLNDKANVIKSYDVAKTLAEAMDALAHNQYDGILSDVFFPIGYDADKNLQILQTLKETLDQKNYKYEQSNKEWSKEKSLPPAGVFIAQYALNNNIPLLFVTDTYHHATKIQSVYAWSQGKDICMVDNLIVIDGEAKKADTKKWACALLGLFYYIEKIHEGVPMEEIDVTEVARWDVHIKKYHYFEYLFENDATFKKTIIKCMKGVSNVEKAILYLPILKKQKKFLKKKK